MKNWRPPNWGDIKAKKYREGLNLFYPANANMELIYEAGAEAMLKYLSSQKHQDWLATPEGESCSGKWVFIPDDD